MNLYQPRASSGSIHERSEGAVTATLTVVVGLLVAIYLGSCAGPSDAQAQQSIRPAEAPGRTYVPNLTVSHPPFDSFFASWMQRLDEPYVYIEHYGSYTDTGAHIPAILREMRVQGLEDVGPPFCLFYDDPATTPLGELHSRACVPIAGPRSPLTPLQYDVLPSRPVANAFVSGPYPEVPRSYPHMFAYLDQFGWALDGPIRESYIVPPLAAREPGDFLCEVQFPFTRRD